MIPRAERAVAAGVAAASVLAAIILSPRFVERHLSPDGSLEPFTISLVWAFRLGVCPAFAAGVWSLLVRRARPDQIAAAVSAAMAAVLGASLLLAAWANILLPAFALAHAENAVYFTTLRWAQGEFPYSDPVSRPIASIVYTPLYPWINALLVRALGPSPAIPKATALAFSILLIGALAIALKRARLSRTAVWFGIAVFLALASPWYLLWARTDSLSALLAFLAILSMGLRPTAPGMAATVALMVLATLAKQTGVFLYPAALAWLWWSGARLGPWLAVGLGYPVAVAAATHGLDSVSGGFYSFWTGRLLSCIPFKPLPLLTADQAPGLAWLSLWLGVGLALRRLARPSVGAGELLRPDPSQRLLAACAIGLAAGLPQLALMSSRIGSGDNNYLPLAAPIAALCAGSLEAWLRAGAPLSPRGRWAAAAVIGASLTLGLALPPLHVHHSILRKAAAFPEMVQEGLDCVSNGPCRGAVLVRGARETASGRYEESVNLTGALAGITAEADEETSLMDYNGAGFAIPDRVERRLRSGDLPAILVPKGFLPFAIHNHLYDVSIPMEPSKRYLYPEGVRASFGNCYRLEEAGLRHFDLYRFRGCRED